MSMPYGFYLLVFYIYLLGLRTRNSTRNQSLFSYKNYIAILIMRLQFFYYNEKRIYNVLVHKHKRLLSPTRNFQL